MRNLIRSFTDFSWALSVFGVSQATKVLQTLPTGDMHEVTQGFMTTTETLKEHFKAFDRTIYQLGETAQNVFLGEPADPSLPTSTAAPQGTSGFVGVWLCQSYSRDNLMAPPPRVLVTISQESSQILNAHYPDPPSPRGGTMQGSLSNDGRVWRGTYSGTTSGRILFVLSEGKNTMYGAWTPNDADGPPRPWYGVRQS